MQTTEQKQTGPYFRPDQAAKYLSVSTGELRKLKRTGRVKCVQLSRKLVRYRQEDLDAMMSSNVVNNS